MADIVHMKPPHEAEDFSVAPQAVSLPKVIDLINKYNIDLAESQGTLHHKPGKYYNTIIDLYTPILAVTHQGSPLHRYIMCLDAIPLWCWRILQGTAGDYIKSSEMSVKKTDQSQLDHWASILRGNIPYGMRVIEKTKEGVVRVIVSKPEDGPAIDT